MRKNLKKLPNPVKKNLDYDELLTRKFQHPTLSMRTFPDSVEYHSDVGFPQNIELPRILNLRPSSHARQQFWDKYSMSLDLPLQVDLTEVDVFEIEENPPKSGNVIKVVFRMPYDDENDISVVAFTDKMKGQEGFIKTVWLNHKKDIHRTLKKWKYMQPHASRKVAQYTGESTWWWIAPNGKEFNTGSTTHRDWATKNKDMLKEKYGLEIGNNVIEHLIENGWVRITGFAESGEQSLFGVTINDESQLPLLDKFLKKHGIPEGTILIESISTREYVEFVAGYLNNEDLISIWNNKKKIATIKFAKVLTVAYVGMDVKDAETVASLGHLANLDKTIFLDDMKVVEYLKTLGYSDQQLIVPWNIRQGVNLFREKRFVEAECVVEVEIVGDCAVFGPYVLARDPNDCHVNLVWYNQTELEPEAFVNYLKTNKMSSRKFQSVEWLPNDEVDDVLYSEDFTQRESGHWKKVLNKMTSGKWLVEVYAINYHCQFLSDKEWSKYFDSFESAKEVYDKIHNLKDIKLLEDTKMSSRKFAQENLEIKEITEEEEETLEDPYQKKKIQERSRDFINDNVRKRLMNITLLSPQVQNKEEFVKKLVKTFDMILAEKTRKEIAEKVWNNSTNGLYLAIQYIKRIYELEKSKSYTLFLETRKFADKKSLSQILNESYVDIKDITYKYYPEESRRDSLCNWINCSVAFALDEFFKRYKDFILVNDGVILEQEKYDYNSKMRRDDFWHTWLNVGGENWDFADDVFREKGEVIGIEEYTGTEDIGGDRWVNKRLRDEVIQYLENKYQLKRKQASSIEKYIMERVNTFSKTMYHGQGKNKAGWGSDLGSGIYWADEEDFAQVFGEDITKADIKMDNVLIVEYPELENIKNKLGDNWVDKLKAMGIKGVRHFAEDETENEFVDWTGETQSLKEASLPPGHWVDVDGTEHTLYPSDEMRREYLTNPIKKVKGTEFLSIKETEFPSESELNENNDFTASYESEYYYMYAEMWLESCWDALFEKEEYEDLSRDDALDKFMDERFPQIVAGIGTIDAWRYEEDNDILCVLVKKNEKKASNKFAGELLNEDLPNGIIAVRKKCNTDKMCGKCQQIIPAKTELVAIQRQVIYQQKYWKDIKWYHVECWFNHKEEIIEWLEDINNIFASKHKGKEVHPKIVYHKSNPLFRKEIEKEGLKCLKGDSYECHSPEKDEAPAIFGYIGEINNYDSTWDDDVWLIHMDKVTDLKWYLDKESSNGVVTYQDIPREAIELVQKGTGKSIATHKFAGMIKIPEWVSNYCRKWISVYVKRKNWRQTIGKLKYEFTLSNDDLPVAFKKYKRDIEVDVAFADLDTDGDALIDLNGDIEIRLNKNILTKYEFFSENLQYGIDKVVEVLEHELSHAIDMIMGNILERKRKREKTLEIIEQDDTPYFQREDEFKPWVRSVFNGIRNLVKEIARPITKEEFNDIVNGYALLKLDEETGETISGDYEWDLIIDDQMRHFISELKENKPDAWRKAVKDLYTELSKSNLIMASRKLAYVNTGEFGELFLQKVIDLIKEVFDGVTPTSLLVMDDEVVEQLKTKIDFRITSRNLIDDHMKEVLRAEHPDAEINKDFYDFKVLPTGWGYSKDTEDKKRPVDEVLSGASIVIPRDLSRLIPSKGGNISFNFEITFNGNVTIEELLNRIGEIRKFIMHEVSHMIQHLYWRKNYPKGKERKTVDEQENETEAQTKLYYNEPVEVGAYAITMAEYLKERSVNKDNWVQVMKDSSWFNRWIKWMTPNNVHKLIREVYLKLFEPKDQPEVPAISPEEWKQGWEGDPAFASRKFATNVVIPDRFKGIVEKIKKVADANGYNAYIVGGFVRDMLLDRESKDMDIMVEAESNIESIEPGIELAELLAKEYQLHEPITFPNFGTAQLNINGELVEFVMPREEYYTEESRNPITGLGTIEQDAMRRDFGMNALFYSINTGEILDLTGHGLSDIENKVVQVTDTDNADIIFHQDPLRMLRAIRQALQLGFTITDETKEAIKRNADRLKIISKERVNAELSKMLLANIPSDGIRMLKDLGLAEYVIPELKALDMPQDTEYHHKDIFEHTMMVLDNTPKDLVSRLSALLHDVGKPATKAIVDETVHFLEHERVGEEMSREILKRLKFPNDIIDSVSFIVGQHMRPHFYNEDWSDSAVRRFIRELGDYMDKVMELADADVSSMNPDKVQTLKEKNNLLRERMKTVQVDKPVSEMKDILNGHELMQLFDKPSGVWIGKVKDYLMEKQLETPELTKDEAIGLAKEFVETLPEEVFRKFECQDSSKAEQWFCKPQVAGSSPALGSDANLTQS